MHAIIHSILQLTVTHIRVQLFNLGGSLSDAERKRRLKGQFRRMSKLRDVIFWTDIGEVGFLDYQKRLKRKQIAIQMATDLHADVTPEKALKMISKAIEAQEKHDQAEKRRRISHALLQKNKNKRGGRGAQRGSPRRQTTPRASQRQSPGRPAARTSSATKSSRKPTSRCRS